MGGKNAIDILKSMKKLADELCETDANLKKLLPPGNNENVFSLIDYIERELDTLKQFTKNDLMRVKSLGELLELAGDMEINALNNQDLDVEIKRQIQEFCMRLSSASNYSEITLMGGYLKRGYTFKVSPKLEFTDFNPDIVLTIKKEGHGDLVIQPSSKDPMEISIKKFKSELVHLNSFFEDRLRTIHRDLDNEIYKGLSELRDLYKREDLILRGRLYRCFKFKTVNSSNDFMIKYSKIGIEFGVLKEDPSGDIFVAYVNDLGEI